MRHWFVSFKNSKRGIDAVVLRGDTEEEVKEAFKKRIDLIGCDIIEIEQWSHN